MPGTHYFSRMTYNVSRGLREIAAPRQSLSKKQWDFLKETFDNRCVYCGELATKENRGIVPDHIIPVTRYGELVIGNAVPACQTCNDSRGDKDWREFLKSKFPLAAITHIQKIEAHLSEHPYRPVNPETFFTETELQQYYMLTEEWKLLLERATALRKKVKARHPKKSG